MGAREIGIRDMATLMYLRKQGDRARQVTEDNVVEVYTWHGGCRFRHTEDTKGRQRITGLTIPVGGRPVPALFGDWVLADENGECAVYKIG
jgi:hypothetical protein